MSILQTSTVFTFRENWLRKKKYLLQKTHFQKPHFQCVWKINSKPFFLIIFQHFPFNQKKYFYKSFLKLKEIELLSLKGHKYSNWILELPNPKRWGSRKKEIVSLNIFYLPYWCSNSVPCLIMTHRFFNNKPVCGLLQIMETRSRNFFKHCKDKPDFLLFIFFTSANPSFAENKILHVDWLDLWSNDPLWVFCCSMFQYEGKKCHTCNITENWMYIIR